MRLMSCVYGQMNNNVTTWKMQLTVNYVFVETFFLLAC